MKPELKDGILLVTNDDVKQRVLNNIRSQDDESLRRMSNRIKERLLQEHNVCVFKTFDLF